MVRVPQLRSRAAARGGIVVLAAVGAVGLLNQLPLTSASFTARTANAGNTFAAASTWCTNPGSVSTSVSNDTMVVESSPTANHEGTAPLMVRARNGDVRRMFVRPVLPSIPSGCTITKAEITFEVAAFTPRTYQVSRVATSWAVGSINWNNQPAPTGTPAVATTTDGTFTVTITDQLIGLYQFGNNGLTMRDQTENTGTTFTNSYNSINNGGAPVLKITYG